MKFECDVGRGANRSVWVEEVFLKPTDFLADMKIWESDHCLSILKHIFSWVYFGLATIEGGVAIYFSLYNALARKFVEGEGILLLHWEDCCLIFFWWLLIICFATRIYLMSSLWLQDMTRLIGRLNQLILIRIVQRSNHNFS